MFFLVMNSTDQEAYGLLAPPLQRWVWKQGWTGLRPIQQASVRPVLERKADMVIAAPTAGGKTEAAFLPIISHALAHPVSGTHTLVISPLKALINDQFRRIGDITAGTEVGVTAWHGDAQASAKAAFRRNPAGILLVTPESLEAMMALSGPWVRDAFRNLCYVVVDEMHAFMGTERGVQIQSLLARLEFLTDARPMRIGLSATIADRKAAAAFLRPDRSRPVLFPEGGDVTADVRIALKEYIADGTRDVAHDIAQELFDRLRGSNNLIFTNSRKDAEATLMNLVRLSQENNVPNEFYLHHGSIAKDQRHYVEKTLKNGLRPVNAVCTASMELGVDIGPVMSVAQIGTALGPAQLRQRLGRSGRRGQPPVLRIFSIDEARDDYKFHLRTNLVQNIAVLQLLARGNYDTDLSPWANASVIVQQTLSLLATHGSFHAAEAYRELCARGAFRAFSQEDFAQILRKMASGNLIAQSAGGQIIVGTAGERLIGSRDFFSAFTTPKDYTIIDKTTQRTVGTVQYKPYYGEVFLLAGARWIVDSVVDRASTVYVSPGGAGGKMMFEGTGPEVSANVTREMRRILASTQTYPYLDPATAAPQHLLEARQWFKKHNLDVSPWLARADGTYMLTWAGRKANRTLALIANVAAGLSLPYDHLAVQGLNPGIAANLADYIAAHDAETDDLAASLAAAVPRIKKERGKFDRYLPDSILDRQYAARMLDLPSASAALSMAEGASKPEF